VTTATGSIYRVEAGGGAFVVNGTIVRTDNATLWSGQRENLRNGTQVEVQGVVVDGQLRAGRVEIEDEDNGLRVAVRGAITNYASASDFRVLGQRVDASGAQFENGAASNLANGRVVDVRGPVADGVLRAERVVFK
jgi:hypothetical protein